MRDTRDEYDAQTGAGEGLGADGEIVEIRTEIEETRLEMGGTLNELGDRLEPSRLVNQAKENVRDATIGRVEETAKGVSEMVMQTIKRNPIPAAIAGTGLALLWVNRSSGQGNGHGGQRSQGYRMPSAQGQGGPDIGGRVSGAASDVGRNVGQTVGQVGDSATQVGGEVIERGRQTVEDVGSRLDRFMQASPLAVGTIALGAGAVIGALVPETPQEREMLGDASRQMATGVRDTVTQASHKAEESLDQVEESISGTRG